MRIECGHPLEMPGKARLKLLPRWRFQFFGAIPTPERKPSIDES